MKLKRFLCAHFAALLLILAVQSLSAQSSGTSGLAGTVIDATGGAIPNVTVTATNNGTGQARTATTGADGAYKFTLLQSGNYKVRFGATGFKSTEIESVT